MALTKKYNMWNKNFICVFIINFVISVVFYLTTVASTSFAKDILNASTSMAGLAVGIFVIGALVSRLYFGSIIDNINIKKAAGVSLLLYFIANASYLAIYHGGLAEQISFALLIIARLCAGMFYGVCSCACGAAVARLVPSNKRGVGIGYYAISVVLASAVGPFLAVWLLESAAYDAIFAICLVAIAAAIAACSALFVRRYKKRSHKAARKGFSVYNYLEKSVLGVGAVVFLIGCAYGAIVSYIQPYSVELAAAYGEAGTVLGLSLIKAGAVFFAVYALVAVFARPISGKVFDKMGADFVIVPSIIFFVAALVILATLKDSAMMVFAAVLVAIGYGNATSSAQSLCIKLCPPEKMGLANSTFFICIDVGMGISPYFLGIAQQHFGYGVVFKICAALVALSLVLYYLLVMRRSADFAAKKAEYEADFLAKNHFGADVKD